MAKITTVDQGGAYIELGGALVRVDQVGAYIESRTIETTVDQVGAYIEVGITTFDAPTNLICSVVSSVQINLSWTDNSSDELGFKIERANDSGGPWDQIDTVGADVTTYQDTGLTPNTTYYYRVRAYK